MKPWYFWRKQGSKRFVIDNDSKPVDIFWDLRSAKFTNGETEPSSDYYVAVLFDGEVVLLAGDMRNDAFKKTGCGPGIIEPTLVSKKEHVFGKRRFFTKAKFHDKGTFHDILITCKNNNNGNVNQVENGSGPEMECQTGRARQGFMSNPVYVTVVHYD
ncbi:uncharacterized protein LOC141653918 [Silene latifolia]|uniref:uncharacterized protein LOC141653918 n=1 Tax=Silene latifolia TaxID=37657 RepID=UPI003D772D71